MLNVDIGYLGSLSIVFRILTARHQVFAKLLHISEFGRKAVTTNLYQLSLDYNKIFSQNNSTMTGAGIEPATSSTEVR